MDRNTQRNIWVDGWTYRQKKLKDAQIVDTYIDRWIDRYIHITHTYIYIYHIQINRYMDRVRERGLLEREKERKRDR